MHFTSIIASAVLAATALAAPSSSTSKPPADTLIAQAQARGVDPFGPIPSDAVKTHEGRYTAEENTDAWHWIRAQGEVPRGLQKRQGSGIGAGFFLNANCQGHATWYDDVSYYTKHRADVRSTSYAIAYRDLGSDERIDFYRPGGTDWCSIDAFTVDGGTQVGCYTPGQTISCLFLRIAVQE